MVKCNKKSRNKHVMAKPDLSNAFNSTRRDYMLEAVQSLCLVFDSFVNGSFSNLFWGDQSISIAERV